MLYDAYQAQSDFLAPLRALAGMTKAMLDDTQFGPAANYVLKGIAAGADIASRAQLAHERPGYEIDDTVVEGRTVPVTEEIALDTPFGNLLHFR